MTSLDKFIFKQLIENEKLIEEIDDKIFNEDQESLKNAYRFIRQNRKDWIGSPTKEQFIELVQFKGEQENWNKDIIDSIFSADERVDNEFLETNYQKKLLLWRTEHALRQGIQKFKQLEIDDYRRLSVESLKERTKKISEEVAKSIESVSVKHKLQVFELDQFPAMQWPDNKPLICGYPLFDTYHLIKRGCITTILGATSSRKSTFLLNIAHRLIKQDYKIMYVIIEGNIRRNVQSLVAQIHSIAMHDVTDESFVNRYSHNVSIAHQNYAMIKVEDIKEIIKDKNYDAIILDYVTLLSEDEENMFLKGQVISQKLKNLAEEFNVAIVTAAQANRTGQNKIQLDHEDVGESHGITMAMDVMLGIIKYKRLELQQKTGLEILKIRDIPDEMATEPAEGKREYYRIHFNNKMLEPLTNTEKLNKQVEADIANCSNDKRMLNKLIKTEEEDTEDKITAEGIRALPL